MNQATQEKLLNLVKENYEAIAEEFSQTRQKYLWPELVNLTNPVKAGDRVLDVGCGNGRLRQAFKTKVVDYVGIDNSGALIKLAQENQELKVSQQEFLVGDILELDQLSLTNFDYIYCVAVLNHLPSKSLRVKALEQMKHKLTDDGKLIITNWNLWHKPKLVKLIFKLALLKLIGRNQMDFGDVVFDWKRGKQSQRYYHAFTRTELKKLSKAAGLRVERLYKDRFNYYLVLVK